MSAALFFLPYPVVANPNGVAAPQAKAYFYQTGTTTPLPIYTTAALDEEHPNPVVADGAGRFPTIYLDNTKIYRVVTTDKQGAPIGDPIDPLVPGTAPSASALQPYADSCSASAVAAAGSAGDAADDAAATAADRTAVAADRVQADADAEATAADRVQTGLDRTATGESYNAIAAAIAPGSLNNATVKASTRAILAGLSTTLPAYLTETGREGMFIFQSANLSTQVTADTNQGVYVAPSSDTTGASGAWVRVVGDFHNVKWFGAKGDNVTNDNAAFVAAVAFLKAIRTVSGFGYGGGGAPSLYVPPGIYYMGANFLEIHCTMRLYGEGMGLAGSPTSILRWDDNSTGIVVAFYKTVGETGTNSDPSTVPTGDGTLIEKICLHGGWVSGNAESESHGIHLRGQAVVRDCFIEYFGGDGIFADTSAGSGGATEGQSSLTKLERCSIRFCRNGVYLNGADANIIYTVGLDFLHLRQWGLWDSGFLGNTHVAHHTNGSGVQLETNGVLIPASMVSYSGNKYFAIADAIEPQQAQYTDISSTSNTIATGALTFTVSSGKKFIAGQNVMIYQTGTPANFVQGTVTSYSGTTLVINATTIGGSGTISAWSIDGTGKYNAPSGTTADNNWWAYYGVGAPTTGVPAWVSGILIRSGGAYRTDNLNAASVFLGCYMEYNEGLCQLAPRTMMIGGNVSTGGGVWKGSVGVNLSSVGNGLTSNQAVSANAYNGSDETFSAQLGERSTAPTVKTILYAQASVNAPNVWRLVCTGADIQWNYQNNATLVAYNITGPLTAQQFGTGAAVPHCLWSSNFRVGSNGTTARLLNTAAAAPASGVYAKGDLLLNNAYTGTGTTTAILGWMMNSTGGFTSDPIYSGQNKVGIGYITGAGGTVTQLTSKATGVTLSKICGAITLNAAALAANAVVSFTLTNTTIAPDDEVIVRVKSGFATPATYRAWAEGNASGSRTIILQNISAGSLSEAVVLGFAVIKSASA